MTFLKQHLFSIILIPLCVFVVVASYYRFIVIHDYVVQYEGDCDPATQQCFVGCEDDECTVTYYYVDMHKYAPDVLAQCGPDVTGCAEASMCLPTDRECSVRYCTPETVDDGEECDDVMESTSSAEESSVPEDITEEQS